MERDRVLHEDDQVPSVWRSMQRAEESLKRMEAALEAQCGMMDYKIGNLFGSEVRQYDWVPPDQAVLIKNLAAGAEQYVRNKSGFLSGLGGALGQAQNMTPQQADILRTGQELAKKAFAENLKRRKPTPDALQSKGLKGI